MVQGLERVGLAFMTAGITGWALRAVALGHGGLQVKLRPDRAVLDYDWQHSINPK